MRLRETVADIVRTASTIWRKYPVETGIMLCLLFTWWHDYFGVPFPRWSVLAPMAAVSALSLNFMTTKSRWRAAYYLSWLPWAVVALAVPTESLRIWAESSQCVITVFILSPLVLLLAHRAADNRRFVTDTVSYFEAIAGTAVCAAVVNLLWFAVWNSIIYIFGLNDNRILGHIVDDGYAVINTVVIGSILLALLDMRFSKRSSRPAAAFVPSRFTDGMVNYLLTPALLIYTAILYIYLAKILLTWSLPKGGVAYMVFGYAITAFGVRALRENSEKRMFERFFDRLSWVVLPTLALFWTGAAHRVAEYGWTNWRVYLTVCGAVMTVCTLLFLFRRTGRYRSVAAAALLLFFITAYIPRFSADRIGLRSQTERAERIAARTGLMLGDGRIDLAPRQEIDTLLLDDYYELGQSLRYLYMNDDTLTLKNRFGLANYFDYYDIFPKKYEYRIHWGTDFDTAYTVETVEIDAPFTCLSLSDGNPIDIAGFSTAYCLVDADCNYGAGGDSVRISLPGRTILLSKAELLRTQLKKAGLDTTEHPTEAQLEAAAGELLVYDTDDMRIVFSTIYIGLASDTPEIMSIYVGSVFVR